MDPVIFQAVSGNDLQSLSAILNYYIENTTVSFHTAPVSEDEMREKVFFGDPAFKAFSVLWNGKLIGYCTLSPWKKQQAYRHTAEINVYLDPDFTNQGIGSLAIGHLLKFARENGFQTLIAGLCSENYPSRRLFEKNGFELCAHFRKVGIKFGRVLDTIYLQRHLEPGMG